VIDACEPSPGLYRTRRGLTTPGWRCSDLPYERLKAIPDVAAALKPGLSFADLDAIAHAMTDNQAAEQLNRERGKLFQQIKSKKVA
jgi:hypothetical protein